MTREPLALKLSGTVEADETYVGGKRCHRTGRPGFGDTQKTAVVALVERGGRVRAFPMPRVTVKNIREAVAEHVDFHRSRLMTDESNLYAGYKAGVMPHETANHSQGEYVRDDVHTNTVEGFFSLLKRGIYGVYHHVGKAICTATATSSASGTRRVAWTTASVRSWR